MERSQELITLDDLKQLALIAREDREDLFKRLPKWKRLYKDRILCVALCQGAALHFLAGKNGVKDFDVWTFYAEHPEAPFPARRIAYKDFGESKFGALPNDIKPFVGRRVDLIGRSLRVKPGSDPFQVIRDFLRKGRTASARELAKKAVVLLEPEGLLGKIVWP
jgi:hypothetical protein